MNERGFFTLIGICFLLVAAILVKGVQESEKNYSYVVRDFKAEADLQNAADSALMEARQLIEDDRELVPPFSRTNGRRDGQRTITLNEKYPVDVKVVAESGIYVVGNAPRIEFMRRNYKSGGVVEDVSTGEPNKKGIIIISVANMKSDLINGKIYRRALGYFLVDGDENILDEEGKVIGKKDYIYFMNSLTKD